MTKVMRYENGKAITGQVDSPFKVDWSEWQTMTDAQKKGKKWLIENVPGAEGEIDAELLTKLWENPNPSSQFAAQNISLSSADYDLLMWVFSYSSSGTNYKVQMCTICEKGADAFLNYATGGSTRSRNCNYTSDTVYAIQAGYTNQTVDNSQIIPIAIYGIKSTVKIKFDALAKDVSTSASKCMLEDGETSVEDALNYSTDEHVVGKWIDGSTLYEKTIYFGTLPNATAKNVAHKISNFRFSVETKGFAYVTASVPIPRSHPNSTYNIDVYADPTYIRITTGIDLTEYIAYVTLRYTKTS